MSKTNKLALLPVMLCFFAMGFVDLVGIASNYVKNDLQLSDSTANVFPSLVFFWFLIFSVPTGMLMNKIGRKKNSAYQPCCYLILSSPANFRRVIRLNARIVFIAWNRQCVDANIVESTGVNGDERWKFSFNTYFRTVC